MISLTRNVRVNRAAAGKAAAPAPALRAVRAAATKGGDYAKPKAPEFDTEGLTKQAQEAAASLAKDLSAKWEATEEKPAAIAISVAALVGVYVASGIMSAIDRLPLFGSLFELIGIGASAWFVYRYLVYGPDREELLSNINAFVNKVAGK